MEYLPTGIFPRRKYMSEEGLKELKNYKYKGGRWTPLELQMDVFWCWCVELLPMSMAPNLVTLSGLLLNVSVIPLLAPWDLKT